MKIQKKRGVGGGGGGGVELGVRVDVTKELKFLGKITQKTGSGGSRVGGSG